jgi:predicted nucleotidyltransferase component of viral defense system
MDQYLAESFARRLNIAAEMVVREEYELALLKVLFESRQGKSLIFKGGTALRLAYGSPRFSDDLDFSATSAIPGDEFRSLCEAAARDLSSIALVEALTKRFTQFALYRVSLPYIPRSFSIKIEMSTRRQHWKLGQHYELKLLKSEISNVSVLAQVATLEKLWKDKQSAFAARKHPRDLYDLWFISQKLGKEFVPGLAGIDKKVIKRELRKYLPRNHWSVIDQWIE